MAAARPRYASSDVRPLDGQDESDRQMETRLSRPRAVIGHCRHELLDKRRRESVADDRGSVRRT